MKKLNQKPGLLLKGGLVIIALSAIYYLYLAHTVMQLAWFNWLSVAVCVIAFVSPQGKTVLQHTPPQHPPSALKVLFQVYRLQILLILCSFGLLYFFNTIPVKPIQPQTNTLPSVIHGLLHAGLFPWPTIAIIAIGLAWQAFKADKVATFGELTKLPQHMPDEVTGIMINSGFRGLTFLTLSLFLSIGILSATNMFYHATFSIQSGWILPAVITATISAGIMLFMPKTLFNQKRIKQFNLYLYFIMLSVCFGLLLGLVYGLSTMLGHHTLKIPYMLHHLFKQPWPTVSTFAYYSWLLGMLPISSLYLARCCQHLSIRSSLIVLLSLPIMLALTFTLLSQSSQQSLLNSLFFSPMAFWIYLASFALLLLLLTNKNNKLLLSSNKIAPPKKIKHRPHTLAQKNITQLTLMLVTLYLIGGSYLTNVFASINCLTVAAYSVITALQIGKRSLTTQSTD